MIRFKELKKIINKIDDLNEKDEIWEINVFGGDLHILVCNPNNDRYETHHYNYRKEDYHENN